MLAEVHRALAVSAHPDDVDFGCAGTIAAWVEDGVAVAYRIVTRGDAGGSDAPPASGCPVARGRATRPGRPGTNSGPGTTGCRGRRGWFVRR
ncbi:PIG-L family deacetylase [Micromonospora sp. U56]|nr:PIG-L family deacetylase [Micromonospora sp. U56]